MTHLDGMYATAAAEPAAIAAMVASAAMASDVPHSGKEALSQVDVTNKGLVCMS